MPEDVDRALAKLKRDLQLLQLKRSLLDPRLDAQDVLAVTDRILFLQVQR